MAINPQLEEWDEELEMTEAKLAQNLVVAESSALGFLAIHRACPSQSDTPICIIRKLLLVVNIPKSRTISGQYTFI